MRCEDCEMNFYCGGSEVCPFDYDHEQYRRLDFKTVCELTGIWEGSLGELIDSGYFGDLYKDGMFDEGVVSMLINYFGDDENE